MDIEDATNNDDDDDDPPEEETFTCLLGVDLLRRAFQFSGAKFSVIIICKEYEFLRELLEKEDGTFIVTGHPGTGS